MHRKINSLFVVKKRNLRKGEFLSGFYKEERKKLLHEWVGENPDAAVFLEKAALRL